MNLSASPPLKAIHLASYKAAVFRSWLFSASGRLSATTRPKRTIRFVLFNAEEEGLVGSG